MKVTTLQQFIGDLLSVQSEKSSLNAMTHRMIVRCTKLIQAHGNVRVFFIEPENDSYHPRRSKRPGEGLVAVRFSPFVLGKETCLICIPLDYAKQEEGREWER